MARMSGKRALLEQLLADGHRYLFGNPGTTEQAFMDLLQDYPQLQFILCLHEGVAVSMADAYARATRKPAFVELHIGPGLGNAGGMLFNAHTAHSPLVAYVGQGDSRAMFQEPHLSGDLVSMARPVTKWAYELAHAADIPQALRRAFKVADEPAQGPVLLSIPVDVLDQEAEVSIQPTSFVRWHVHPEPAAIDEAAELLAASRRPMVLVGDGVSLSGAQAEVARVAELLGAPIYQGYATECNVPADHPLTRAALPFMNTKAMGGVLGEHDALLAVGTPLFRAVFPEPGGIVPQGTRVVQIDLDSWELGKNLAGVLAIEADPRAALAALAERLDSRPVPGAAARAEAIAAERRRRIEQVLDDDRRVWDETPISVPRLMGELADVLPADAAVFDESTTAGGVLTRYIKPQPGRYFRARGGGLGPGLPGTVALKLAMPDRPVVGVVSDGAAMYTVSALWTAAHHRVPVTWVICNNASYRILKLNVMDYLGPAAANRQFVALDLTDPPLHYDRIAEALGVHGRRVERPEDLRPALEEALALNAPALVDVAIQGRVP
jgi:thiamine pyrophosphate-dependent acetolactate synthase large subunit-like protein